MLCNMRSSTDFYQDLVLHHLKDGSVFKHFEYDNFEIRVWCALFKDARPVNRSLGLIMQKLYC